MTNLSDEDLEELEFAEKTRQDPGFLRSTAGHNDDKWEEFKDDNNQLHRLTGPAIRNIRGTTYPDTWYYHGKKIACKSQEEFIKFQQRLLKIKAFW